MELAQFGFVYNSDLLRQTPYVKNIYNFANSNSAPRL